MRGAKKRFLWGRRSLSFLLFAVFCVAALGGLALSLSAAVAAKEKEKLLTVAEASAGEPYDVILVLGCGVKADGSLSDMLADRVSTAATLYHAGAAPIIVMSGDHRNDDYNETGAMRREAERLGVPGEAIEEDAMGLSTLESIGNLKKSRPGVRVLIVTQEYHLPRALYIAERAGLRAEGVPADLRGYVLIRQYRAREILARCKDVIVCEKRFG